MTEHVSRETPPTREEALKAYRSRSTSPARSSLETLRWELDNLSYGFADVFDQDWRDERSQVDKLWRNLSRRQADRLHDLVEIARKRAIDTAMAAFEDELVGACLTFADEHPSAPRSRGRRIVDADEVRRMVHDRVELESRRPVDFHAWLAAKVRGGLAELDLSEPPYDEHN